MAPLANDPGQVLIVLNLGKRKALYTLVTEITQYMRSQVKLEIPPNSNVSSDAPLFVPGSSRDRSDENEGDPGRLGTPQRTLSAPLPTSELVRLRKAALAHFDAWQTDVLTKLKELLPKQDDAGTLVDRRERANKLARQRAEVASPGENLIDFGGADHGKLAAEADRARAVARLQESYHPVPTRLTTISVEDREETLSCVLLILLSTGKYVAESRTLAVYLTSAFQLPISVLNTEEVEISKMLVEKSTSEEAAQQTQQLMSADAEAEKRKQENQSSRYWKVGIASVAGAALIGVTGGLAAPVVAGAIGSLMGGVGLGGVASFLGVFWMNGALVGTLFGAFGAKMTGEMIDRYAREVKDFRFIPLKSARNSRQNSRQRNEAKDDMRLRVTIGVNGWLTSEKDIIEPWRLLGDDSEVFALRYEVDSLMGLGQSLKNLISSRSWNYVKAEILKRTVLATLWSALWPAYLLSAAAGVDNPFSLARNRSEKAGEILADAIINKVQGERPITLIGYSLGARAIYSCLRSLAARKAFGLVDTVVLIGAPVPSTTLHWQLMRTVVSGNIYNIYSENDFLLAFLYRTTSLQLGVAGLQPIHGVEGVENINLTEEVQGHMKYSDNIAKILDRCGFPVVQGAAGPIEKEQDSDPITLDDLENGPRTGTLIDFGDLSVADPSPSRSPTRNSPRVSSSSAGPPTSNPSRNPDQAKRPTRPVMVKMSPSEILLASHDDPISSFGGADSLERGSGVRASSGPSQRLSRTTSSTPTSLPSPPIVSPTKSISAEQTPQPPKSVTPDPIGTRIIVSATNTKEKLDIKPAALPREAAAPSLVLPSSHDDDEDDEDYGGIKMIDNDDEDFEYVDPEPIEDDDGGWRN